jgi:membrane protein implicated in regulation of membrane protease activity
MVAAMRGRRAHQLIALIWLVIAVLLLAFAILTLALHKLEVGPASILIAGAALDFGLAIWQGQKALRSE